MPRFNKITDPAAVKVPAEAQGRKRILGLDLGTNCGYCVAASQGGSFIVRPELVGQWDLSAGPYDSGAIRFLRLRYFLAAVRPDLVAYEDVKFTPDSKFSAAKALARASTAAELIGAFRATLVTWCEERSVPCVGIPIGTIKKRATGKGNASKEEMIAACNETFGTDFTTDDYSSTGADNVADSIWIARIAHEQYSEGFDD